MHGGGLEWLKSTECSVSVVGNIFSVALKNLYLYLLTKLTATIEAIEGH